MVAPRSYTDEWHDMVALCKAQADEIVRLRAICRKAMSLCRQCYGRGIDADKVLDVLARALEEEAE